MKTIAIYAMIDFTVFYTSLKYLDSKGVDVLHALPVLLMVAIWNYHHGLKKKELDEEAKSC